jgi:hypothetical protein
MRKCLGCPETFDIPETGRGKGRLWCSAACRQRSRRRSGKERVLGLVEALWDHLEESVESLELWEELKRRVRDL